MEDYKIGIQFKQEIFPFTFNENSLLSSSNISSGYESLADSPEIITDVDLMYNYNDSNNVEFETFQLIDSQMESDVFCVNNEHFADMPLNNPIVFYSTSEFSQIHYSSDQFDSKIFNHQFNSNSSSIQLWQFLLELLENKNYRNLIRWTSTNVSALANHSDILIKKNDHDNEFLILDFNEIARLWGLRCNKPNMSYKKFRKALRYYYNKKKILNKRAGKRNSFSFLANIEPYLQHLQSQQDQFNWKMFDQYQFFQNQQLQRFF